MRPVLTVVVGVLLCLGVVLTGAQAAETYVSDRQWGSEGHGEGEFDGAWGIGMNLAGDRLVVTEISNDRLQVFTLNGAFIRQVTAIGAEAVNAPSDVMCDSQGKWYVSSLLTGKVLKSTPGFGFVSTIGTQGLEPGELQIVYGLWVDRVRNRLYVADVELDRINLFRLTGLFHSLFASGGTGSGQIHAATDVATDSNGNIYVADGANDRIQKFSRTYDALGQWDAASSGQSLSYPAGLYIDSADYVYVSDYNGNRVCKFTTNGTLVTTFGTYGSGDGEMYNPAGLVTDLQGRLYVVDRTNDRVQRFVRNYVPTAPTTATISPALPRDNQQLTGTASGSTDADGATLTYQLKWWSSPDGSTWTARRVGATLSSTMTTVGQHWRLTARAFDGRSYGPWRQSAPVVIHGMPALAVTSAVAQGRSAIVITVSLTAAAEVEMQVCNMAGRVVAVMPARRLEAGTSSVSMAPVSVNGTKLPAGQYLLRLRALQEDGGSASAVCAVSVR